MDKLTDLRDFSGAEQQERGDLITKLKEIEEREITDLKQKAKIKWVVDGDENSNFFHGIINCRNRNNRMHGLAMNGAWETEPHIIKNHVFTFFKEKFKELTIIARSFGMLI